ncbi:MAG TPA: aromatic amino acid ammonia-lyase [Candidatus Limnocylindrales bacterium]|nr:aromatic amino acid ammonia-lyase [Candidatus Limnocylindrales bacterium]
MSVAAPGRVVVDDAPLTTGDVVAIARGADVTLGPVAIERIRASRAVVDRLVTGNALVYGLNTGLGHGRNERMPLDALEASQAYVVRAHAGGLGPPLPTETVRAAMAVRVAGIARGGSGASPAMAESYVAMLNAGVHPVVPVVGSIGASDLMHMAAIALVALGEGEAELGGERLPGGEALTRAGIAPLRLGPKDGLTIISANGVSIGHAALVVDRAAGLADVADLVVALSLEAAGGNPSIVEPVVAAAKPVAGQALAAARIRSFLDGSRLAVTEAESVQDPLSFRVAPQVHGAFREVVGFATAAVDGELAAMDDNPLVSIEEGRMVSNGNFHPMLLALAVDAIRPALAHIGQLSDRRAGQLWDRLATDTGAFGGEAFERMSRYGSPLLRYSGAARAAELRTLAGPATLDVAPLDLGVEDHATNAPLAIRLTDAALDVAEDVLAVELLTATASVGWQDETRGRMSPRTAAALDLVASTLAALGPGASSAAVHGAARDLLHGPLLTAAALPGDAPAGRP